MSGSCVTVLDMLFNAYGSNAFPMSALDRAMLKNTPGLSGRIRLLRVRRWQARDKIQEIGRDKNGCPVLRLSPKEVSARRAAQVAA